MTQSGHGNCRKSVMKASCRDQAIFVSHAMPTTAFLAPLYRSPICLAGAGPDKDKVVSFKY
jgi:hypothetical protein